MPEQVQTFSFGAGDRIDGLCVEKRIGEGAYGVVYLARDELIGRRVALKVVSGQHAVEAESARAQVLNEARLIGGLTSPHIVTLYRLHSSADGGWMLQMEFVDGGSLEDEIKLGEPMALDEAVNVFRGVCMALKTAHDACVLHGDIKPANVLFAHDRTVKLADFGIARMLEAGGEPMELFGQMFGTPRFMAPEVMSGTQAGRGTDLWSAAVLFYLCLTGRYPFSASSFGGLAQGILSGEPDSMGSQVPPELVKLILRCLEKEPANRPQSASEVLAELDAFTLGVLSSAGPAIERQKLTNCSLSNTTFVGRDAELRELGELLSDPDARIVTMTGPGGIGKTRLAQELCVDIAGRLPGGAWFADLSETEDGDGVAHAVAKALRVELPEDEEALTALANILQFRPPLLVVLDNFEQLVDSANETVGAWVRAAPQIQFLVTSRALLGLAGEQSFELAPLGIPDLDSTAPSQAAALLAFPAIRLFRDRAHEADPRFELDDAAAPHVLKICSELDGMPLAIELAAARARVLKPAAIARHLEEKFQLLASTRRDLSPRQRSLTAAIEWSYDLLEPWEREAFLQSCSFREGFSLDAVAEVLDLSSFDDAPFALDVAQSLRDKSLLTATDTGYEHRLGMYRTIREFGARKWCEEADEEKQRELALRHARFFVALAEEWNELIPSVRDQEALDRIGLELGNLGAAQDRALEYGEPVLGARAVLAAAKTARLRRPSRQLTVRIEKALETLPAEEPSIRAGLLVQLAAACGVGGDWERALSAADEAIEIAQEAGDERLRAEALLQQGEMRRSGGDVAGAMESFAECESTARAANVRHTVAACIGSRGAALGAKGDLDGALACFEEAATLAREVGDFQTLARSVSNRGVVLEHRGLQEEALACQREAEELSRRIGNRIRIALSLRARANLHSQIGDLDSALPCYEEAELIARELGAKQSIARIVGDRGSAHSMRGEDDEAIACYAVAEEIARDIRDNNGIAQALGKRGTMHVRRGEHDDSLACFTEAEQLGEQLGDPRIVAKNRCQRGHVYRLRGELVQAWDVLRSGLAIYEEMNASQNIFCFGTLCELIQIAREQGESDSAQSLAREALDLAIQLRLDEGHPDERTREGVALVRSIAGTDR